MNFAQLEMFRSMRGRLYTAIKRGRVAVLDIGSSKVTCLVLRLDLASFFGLKRLVEPLREASTRHQTPGELVHNNHTPVLDHILDVLLEQGVRFQQLVEIVDRVGSFGEVTVGLVLGLHTFGSSETLVVIYLGDQLAQIR